MDITVTDLIVRIVKDLEDTRDKYCGYAYVRTIRNILVGNEDAIIAPNFKDKHYYGMISFLTLEETETMLDRIVENRKLECIYTSHGKLYCTPEYYQENHKHS